MDLERMSAPPVYAADVEGRRVEGDARCEHLMDLYWSEMITHHAASLRWRSTTRSSQ